MSELPISTSPFSEKVAPLKPGKPGTKKKKFRYNDPSKNTYKLKFKKYYYKPLKYIPSKELQELLMIRLPVKLDIQKKIRITIQNILNERYVYTHRLNECKNQKYDNDNISIIERDLVNKFDQKIKQITDEKNTNRILRDIVAT